MRLSQAWPAPAPTETDWGNALTHSVVYFLSVPHSIPLLSLTHLLDVLPLNRRHLFISTASICPSSILSVPTIIFSPLGLYFTVISRSHCTRLSVFLPITPSARLNWSVCPCMYLYIPLTVPSASQPFQPHPPTSMSHPNWIPAIISILSFCSSLFLDHSVPLIFHNRQASVDPNGLNGLKKKSV